MELHLDTQMYLRGVLKDSFTLVLHCNR